jgi:SAM-dependent methyltransferase
MASSGPGWRWRISEVANRLSALNAVQGTAAGYRLFLKRNHGFGKPLGYPVAPWNNAVLKTHLEWKTAVGQVETLGLPAHPVQSKNWDSLAALACILERTDTSAHILDAGSAASSVILPWLFLYGYTKLFGINLEFPRPFKRGSIRYENGDLTRTRFEPDTFEAVVCQSVLEHGVDIQAYFKEMARILKTDGVLTTSVDYYVDPVDTKGHTPFGLPYRVFTPDDIRAMLSTAGDVGLVPTGTVDLTCEDRPVNWKPYGLDYTYLMFTLRKSGRRATPGLKD